MLRTGAILMAAVLVNTASHAEPPPPGQPILLDVQPLSANSPYIERVSYQNSHTGRPSGLTPADVAPRLAPAPAPSSVLSAPAPAAHTPIVTAPQSSFAPVSGACPCPPASTMIGGSPATPYSVVPISSYRPLVPIAATPTHVVRRGILGQPTVFVPGQPVRNFVRWLTP